MLKRIEEAVSPITSQPTIHTPAVGQIDTQTRIEANKPTTIPNNNANAIKSKINSAITESPNLVSALESVCAMYGIPPSHIIADDTATNIRVVDDNIIAPPIRNPKNQTKPIIQAVGSVLDYISQRIDDKLDEYQLRNIDQGKIDETIANADPSKGKCIGRFVDDEGGEILAYDTGIVDMPCTPAARAKVIELRANKIIPDIDLNKLNDTKQTYFNDDDDITSNVDMDASANDVAGDVSDTENDVSEEIQESAYHINMISKFNNTRHLGYDLLQKHGFDFVKPIDTFVMESAKPKKTKTITPNDVKHMKFDNTNILKAVKFFNKARAAQSNVKNDKLDLDKFINDPNYEKAIDCLNKQFDCRINLRFIKDNHGNASTFLMNDIKKNLTISKSKGFQLGGLPIDIFVFGHYFEISSPNEQELFGQNTVATICHEIFHNIACVMRSENAKMNMSLAMTLQLATNTKNVKDRRTIITNYVDSIGEMNGNKFIDTLMKKKLIKQLTVLTSINDNENVIKNIKKTKSKSKSSSLSSDEYIDKLIKTYKSQLRMSGGTLSNRKYGYILPMIVSATTILIGCLTPGMNMFIVSGCGLLSLTLGLGLSEHVTIKNYKNTKMFEEYYCDLFASMYKLPIFFFVGPDKFKRTVNEFDTKRLNDLTKVEKDLYEAIYASYPTDLERTYAAVTIAKKLLEQGGLDPAIKKYCQWIVDNFSNVQDTDIKTMYNKTTFDPQEAENLDKHLEKLINDNNVVLTESFVEWLVDENQVFN